MLAFSLFLFTACNTEKAKPSKYAISVDYSIAKMSRYSIVITGKYNTIVIPESVSEFNSNDKYILVKQLGMKRMYPDNIKNAYTIPDETKVYYWIIDKTTSTVLGPFDINEYEKAKDERKIPNLKLNDVHDYVN